MITFAKVICWLTILSTIGVGIYYGVAVVKNLDKFSGARFLVKFAIFLSSCLTVLFKGIFGLHILAPEPGVLSTGNVWLLLAILIVPTQTWFAAVFDFVFVMYLGSLHPSSPTALTVIACIILAFQALFLFIENKMEKKEKQAAPAQETAEEPAEK